MTIRSEDILICDELVDYLNARSYSEAFYAERVYVADWNFQAELSELRLAVWPGDSEASPFERGLLQKDYRTGLTFAKQLEAATRDSVDRLMDVVKEIQEDLELSTVTIPASSRHPDGVTYINTGWDYPLRFNDLSLDRHKGADGIVKYTGLFASILVFEWTSLE